MVSAIFYIAHGPINAFFFAAVMVYLEVFAHGNFSSRIFGQSMLSCSVNAPFGISVI